jgi:APA family basic amino acid/polyamine antiporter
MVSAALAAVLVWSNSSRSLGGLFAFMALLSAVSSLVLYAACAIAALKEPIGRAAKGVAALGLLFTAWTFYGAGLEACLWGAALLAAGIPIWFGSRALNQRGGTSPAPAE